MSRLDLLPTKERLIVKQLQEFIDAEEDYTVALVSGVRKVGKTVALKQLKRIYGEAAVYMDLSESTEQFEAELDAFLDNDAKVLLLDEISYLKDFESISQGLYNLSNSSANKRFKVIITGSSAAHLTKLCNTKLGGGRSKLFRLTPIKFVEYLYFTGRIPDYSSYKNATLTDFVDYLRLEGLTDLTIQFDDTYFDAFYKEVVIGNKQRGLSYSLIDLESGDLLNMARLLAYKLSEPRTYDATVDPAVGNQERYNLRNLTPRIKFAQGVDLSDAMVSDSANHVKGITARDKGRILEFMLQTGLACIELQNTGSDTDIKDSGYVLNELEKCTKESELRNLFDKVSICLTTPLFYTRLGEDILRHAGVDISKLFQGSMLGKMLEVYLRGAVVMTCASTTIVATKLAHADVGEVDLYEANREILIESSISNKGAGSVNVGKYFKEEPFIRVCSTRDKDFYDGEYHRISYPILCCMLDTGDINMLPRSFGKDQQQKVAEAEEYGKAKQPADMTSDIVTALVYNTSNQRIGVKVWRHETRQAEVIPVPSEFKSWNLDIVHNRLVPKLCSLSDFPVLLDTGEGEKHKKYSSGGWVIGRYEDGCLRLMSVNGRIKKVTQAVAIPFYKKYKLANAVIDDRTEVLIGKFNRWFDKLD